MPQTTNIVVHGKRAPRRDPNELTVEAGGRLFGGWQDVRLTRRAEGIPNDFDIRLTERYPGQASVIDIHPGQTCIVRIGNDRVITGYIDRYAAGIGPDAHQVSITGRGKTQDLVDCSAVLQGMAIGDGQAQADALIGPLVQPFGIEVRTSGNLTQTPGIPQFSVNLGETPWDIIDRISRYAQLLAYEDTFGNLVLSQVGTASMASGVAQGVNIQSAEVTYAMDQRFSVYTAYVMSQQQFTQIGPMPNVGQVSDPTVPRYRPRIIISEQTQNGQAIAQARLNWELARRIGRSQALRATVSGWRDVAGGLWAPNVLLTVDAPALKISRQQWIIGEATFIRSDAGSICELTAMPPAAYQPEPEVLQAFNYQVADALPGGAAAQ